jgi:hypothetical protein
MNKLIHALIFVIAALLGSGSLFAQDPYAGLSYSMALPGGNSADYTEDFSFRGFAFEAHGFITDEITLGGYVGWNIFNDKLSGEFTDETLTVTGTQQRFLNVVPITLESRYHFFLTGDSGPFLGFGIGTHWTEQRTQLGVFEVTDKDWQLLFAPNVGYQLPVGGNALQLNIRYHTALESGDVDGQSYVSFNLGFILF